ncbi:MAG TPA: TolC family protein, partial [Elusimicrobiales bacterium]|nr:TolC family protein [Elusimicrobiales bacterium]
PGVSVSHSYSRNGSADLDPANNYNLGITASETLFSMKSYAETAGLLKSSEKADLDLRAALADTRKNLLAAFITTLYAQEKIRVADTIVAIREKSAEMTGLKYDSGRESYGNRLRAEAQLAQAKADLAQAKRDLDSARRALAAHSGADEYSVLSASGALSVPAAVAGLDIDKAALAMPGVLSVKKTLELYQLKAKQTGADLFPTLTASQGLNWAGPAEASLSRSWSLGLSLSWPLFSKGPSYYKNSLAAANSNARKAEQDYRGAVLNAKAELGAALAALGTGIENVSTADLLLNAARQRYSEAETQYLVGTLSFQNWEDVETELVSSEQTYLNSLRSVNTARAEVDRLLGIPLGD